MCVREGQRRKEARSTGGRGATGYLCAGPHLLACFPPSTPWTGADDSLPNTPPQQSGCSGPWKGERGPLTCSGKPPDAAAPQSPGLVLRAGQERNRRWHFSWAFQNPLLASSTFHCLFHPTLKVCVFKALYPLLIHSYTKMINPQFRKYRMYKELKSQFHLREILLTF